VFNLLPAGSLDRLELALGRSREFRVWYRNDDATIYQLVDAPRSLQGPPRKEGDR
jgi:hypothetical protein